jgi:hypothetical protein
LTLLPDLDFDFALAAIANPPLPMVHQ